MIQRSLIILAFLSICCFGQRIEVGAMAGVPVTNAFATGSDFHIDFGESATSATRRYTIGPTVGLTLSRRFGVEFDALYRPLGFDRLDKTSGVLFDHTRTTADSWEFPLVAKYRLLRMPFATPFVEGGVAFRTISRVSSVTERYLDFSRQNLIVSTSGTSETLANRSSHGEVLGVGVEFHFALMRVSPKIRYTRWGADQNLDPLLHSNQNQTDVLLGVTF
jgi:hypothetical protein